VNKLTLIERIAELVREKLSRASRRCGTNPTATGCASSGAEARRHGDVVLNQLYRFTRSRRASARTW
jgi:hypothetical protein